MKPHIRIEKGTVKKRLYDKLNRSTHLYDEFGNELFMKRINPDGQIFKRWTEWKNINGYWCPVRTLNSYNHEDRCEYNNDGQLTYLKRNAGFHFELWKTYDEEGRLIQFKDSNGKIIDYNQSE